MEGPPESTEAIAEARALEVDGIALSELSPEGPALVANRALRAGPNTHARNSDGQLRAPRGHLRHP